MELYSAKLERDPSDVGARRELALAYVDGGGVSNLAEYIRGQAANVPDKYNWTTSTDPLTGHITVSFPTLVGGTYKVLYSQTLQSWLDGSPVITGNGSTMSWTDDGGSTGASPAVTSKRFYRVEASTGDP